MSRDVTCVYRAADVGEADIVAAWLEEQGIAAFVKDHTVVSLYGPLAMSPRGVEVCVLDAAQVDRAQALVGEHVAEIRSRKQAQDSGPPVSVVCATCFSALTFPGSEGGRVQICPKCKTHLDVPAA